MMFIFLELYLRNQITPNLDEDKLVFKEDGLDLFVELDLFGLEDFITNCLGVSFSLVLERFLFYMFLLLLSIEN